MAKLNFSLRSALAVISVLCVSFAVLSNRVARQVEAVREIRLSGGTAFFSIREGTPGEYAGESDGLSHWYRRIVHVQICPNDNHPMSTLIKSAAKIPRLDSICVYPDRDPSNNWIGLDSPNGATDNDLEILAEQLPKLRHLILASARCSKTRGEWLEEKLPNLNSGRIMYHLEIDRRGLNHEF